MYSDWTVFVEDNDNNRGQNITSWRGQRLIQVQLIYSLPFVTTMKKNTTKKKLDRFFNAVGQASLPLVKKKTYPTRF